MCDRGCGYCNYDCEYEEPNFEPLPIFCSFCGKSKEDCTGLVAGPAVYICRDCTIEIARLFNLMPKEPADV